MIRISINLLILLVMPFLFHGLIVRTKAFWAGRQGPPLWQLFHDCRRLFSKRQVISPVTTQIFQIAPLICWGSITCSGLFVPLGTEHAIIDFPGNLVAFAYTLGLGRFFIIIAALDTGSSFEGMGASREGTFASIAETALFIVFAVLVTHTGHTSLSQLSSTFNIHSESTLVIMGLCIPALIIILIVEACRVPVDDPTTHLELTMIHEVMILDHSGVDLALFSHAAAMKMVIFGGIICELFIPPGLPALLHLTIFLFLLTALAFVIGLVESWLPRLRLHHVPHFIFAAISLALTALAVIFIHRFGVL